MESKGKTIFGVVFVIILFVCTILVAQWIQTNPDAQDTIASFGVLGILLVSFIGGLNLVFPIPATAFIPVFSAAGFATSLIVTIIVIGTTIADLIAYYIGTILKPKADKIHNRFVDWLRENCVGKPMYTGFVVFLYAAIIPFPNEVLLLPLGSLGMKLKNLVVPFTLGTAVHVTALAYGFSFFV